MKQFKEVFPSFKIDGYLNELLERVQVRSLKYNENHTKIYVGLVFPRIVSEKLLNRLAFEISGQCFKDMHLFVVISDSYELDSEFSFSSLVIELKESLIAAISKKDPISRQLLLHGDITGTDDQKVLIRVEKNIFSEQYKDEWKKNAGSYFSEKFNLFPEVRLEFFEKNDEHIYQRSEAFYHKKTVEPKPENLKKEDAGGDLVIKTAVKKEEPKEPEEPKTEKAKDTHIHYLKTHPNVIYGYAITKPTEPIENYLIDEMGPMTVEGEIIRMDIHPITQKDKVVIQFDLTDYTDTVTVKLITNSDDFQRLSDSLKVGSYVKVDGVSGYDKFQHGLLLSKLSGIEKAEPRPKKIRRDDFSLKRVELHCHTKFSDFDAIASPIDLVKLADSFGEPAIALTDHGCMYAYPDLYKELQKENYMPNTKIIYGVEAYLVDDDIRAVHKNNGALLSDSAVVFDLETTGLSPKKDKIIEIGAVKLENGKITDRFSAFVNPEMPISYRTEELTHITDSMLKNAETIDLVLPKFLDFIRGSYLVAHNADFDIGFIVSAIEKYCPWESKEFTYLDTVSIGRALLPQLNKFTLDHVAKNLGVSLENHHRAVDDADCTAQIYLKFCEKLVLRNVTNLTMLEEETKPTREMIRKLHPYHVILLAKNQKGLKNLYEIQTKSSVDYLSMGTGTHRPLTPISLVNQYREGILVGSACSEGQLYEAILRGASDERLEKIISFYDYLEIQPTGNNAYLIREQNYSVQTEEDLQEINREIIRLGKVFNKPVCATCDVHFMNPEDAFFREVLQTKKGFKDAAFQPPLFFRTTEEMLKEFEYLGSDLAEEVVVTNPNRIADSVEKVEPISQKSADPEIPNAANDLRDVCLAKAHRLFGENIPEIVTNRLEKELQGLSRQSYESLYMIARKLVAKAAIDGYFVGSRGSVGSSLVAYMADISEVNPLPPHYICPECHYSEFIAEDDEENFGRVSEDLVDRVCPKCKALMKKYGFNIPFETFLGFNADKKPDIDLNFPSDYQSKAHAYTEIIFGQNCTLKAGTVSAIQENTARNIVYGYFKDKGEEKRPAEIARLAKKIEGVRQSTSQHPGGIVVVPKGVEVTDFTPVQYPANDPEAMLTTSFDYHAIEQNLLKLDILGHKDPTMMKLMENIIGKNPYEFPVSDPQVLSLFRSTEALGISPSDIHGTEFGILGIPEFGTDFAMGIVKSCKPTKMNDLVRITGMAHGEDVWSNNNEILFNNGSVTLDTAICCRDDIMIYLISKGMDPGLSFKIMEKVRKGKGLTPEWEEEMRNHGISETYIWSCNKIRYMFPKAHAAAYVMSLSRIAYCKLYYPLAFYCGYYSVRAKAFDYEKMCFGLERLRKNMKLLENKKETKNISDNEKAQYQEMRVVEEMYVRGFSFVPIDLSVADSTLFRVVDERHIMPALNAVNGLGDKVAFSIVLDRAMTGGQKYTSQDDFKNRTHATQTNTEELIRLGILKGLPKNNQLSFSDFL